MNSFDSIDNWIKQINENSQLNISKILVGNKCDKEKERVIKREDAEELAKKYDIKYFETSAKTNEGVTEVFKHIALELSSNLTVEEKDKDDKSIISKRSSKSIKLTKEEQAKYSEKKKKGGCCKSSS